MMVSSNRPYKEDHTLLLPVFGGVSVCLLGCVELLVWSNALNLKTKGRFLDIRVKLQRQYHSTMSVLRLLHLI